MMGKSAQNILKVITIFSRERKYELLFLGLMQHLFVGIFVHDFEFYVRILWPINMVILAVLSTGLFLDSDHWVNRFKIPLYLAVILFPVGLAFFGDIPRYLTALSIAYILFFLILFYQVFRYMVRPSYINIDLITSAVCGFLILIEIFVFVSYLFIHLDPRSFINVNLSDQPSIFIDLVYYSSVTLTTIGYGDIIPNTPQMKLTSAVFGIAGQLYQILLVGVLISKFTSKGNKGLK